MSFILEQLKKSGRKRQIELEMRKVQARPGAERKAHQEIRSEQKSVTSGLYKRTTLLYLLLAVFLINGSLFVWWLYPRVFEKTGRNAQSGYTLKPVPTAYGPEKGVYQEQVSSQFVSLPEAKPVIKTKKAPETQKPAESLPVAGSSRPPVLNKDLSGPLPAGTAGAPGRIGQNPDRTDGVKKIKDTAAAVADNKAGIGNPQIETHTGTAKDVVEKSKLPDLQALPAALRKQLPELRISSHLYSNDRKSRLVSINGRIMQEGYNMSDGLYLDEITRDGVILDYQGHRFHMKAD